MKRPPRRGDVYWVNLDSGVRTEIRKTRPAVIVSNDSCNRYGTRVVVLPITSHEQRRVPLPGRGEGRRQGQARPGAGRSDSVG
jgi:mRNA interferase MazF